jgi:hypothetical protein
MTIGNLITVLEHFDQDEEFVVEISKADGETITTYAVNFAISEFGEFMLTVQE